MRTEPVDFAAAINPVVAIVATGQPFDVSILVTRQHGYNLPVALIDTVRSKVNFCFCHPFFMHEPQEQKKLRCDSALFVTQPRSGEIALRGLCLQRILICFADKFSFVFNAIVGSQSHSPEQYYCYKFRGFWIPVALPPPALLDPTLSVELRTREKPNNGGH